MAADDDEMTPDEPENELAEEEEEEGLQEEPDADELEHVIRLGRSRGFAFARFTAFVLAFRADTVMIAGVAFIMAT